MLSTKSKHLRWCKMWKLLGHRVKEGSQLLIKMPNRISELHLPRIKTLIELKREKL